MNAIVEHGAGCPVRGPRLLENLYQAPLLPWSNANAMTHFCLAASACRPERRSTLRCFAYPTISVITSSTTSNSRRASRVCAMRTYPGRQLTQKEPEPCVHCLEVSALYLDDMIAAKGK